jgi:hypothetical protein
VALGIHDDVPVYSDIGFDWAVHCPCVSIRAFEASLRWMNVLLREGNRTFHLLLSVTACADWGRRVQARPQRTESNRLREVPNHW